jgi:SAM-dependent methyltransferase
MKTFPIKRLPDGRALLNLGSSARVAPGWNNIDFSLLMRFAPYPRFSSFLYRAGLLSTARYERIQKLDRDAIRWDLRKGIPFPDRTFDCVYHSHVLEHIDRDAALPFLQECFRVLKPGAILRVVLPDLEVLTRDYLDCLSRLPGQANMSEHRFCVEEIFDQMVVRVPKARARQKWIVRVLENLFIGNTERSGTLHRWMYDKFSLAELLQNAGCDPVNIHNHISSSIPDWNRFLLDVESDGSPYKRSSLYIEGRRPITQSSGEARI